jgi:deoxyhypusine synthase
MMVSEAENGQAPSTAQDAVLKPSEFATEGVQEISGVDFNKYADRNITVAELVDSMANMGFQATSVGEAVKLVNEMVRHKSCQVPVHN